MKERIKYRLLCGATIFMAILTVFMIMDYAKADRKPTRPVSDCFYSSDMTIVDDMSRTEAAQEEKTDVPKPFNLERVDAIRVLITNKENGSIYHVDIEAWNGNHGYRGTIETIETDSGYIVINELPLEEYLYSVVPSEMPAGYPMEALKAQAICARTYAYLHVYSPAYPQWNAHVDDTTAFQVYHSVEEQESTTQAVDETRGMILVAPDKMRLAETYYYSTSCGYGSDAKVWRSKYSDNYPYIKSKRIAAGKRENEAVETMSGAGSISQNLYNSGESMQEELLFHEYINAVHEADYEAGEGWYRWTYAVNNINKSHMLKNLKKRYEANPELVLTLVGDQYISRPIEELETLVDLKIDKRGNGGVADELIIITEKNVYKVITELNIRYVLNDGNGKVKKQDGTAVSMTTLLPSAFIVLENQYADGEITGYVILGGGFGHGAGMSQNAAKAMATEGMTAEEILAFFFEDCTLEISEEGVLYD